MSTKLDRSITYGLTFVAFAAVVVFATYLTFEALPALYGKRWVPILVMGAYTGLFATALAKIKKLLWPNATWPDWI